MTDDIVSELSQGTGTIELNRPERINALNSAMITQISDTLHSWADDDRVERVELRGAGSRGFCAGADIRLLRDQFVAGHPELVKDFLFSEYQLQHDINSYAKPITAYLSGISMGGGLGLGLHNTKSIAEPDTRWAMPEVMIGLWPDVGVTYELSRAPGRVGEYLAMTGYSIDGASAAWAGLVVECCGGVDPQSSPLVEASQWIDECFASDDPVAIVADLAAHSHPDAQKAAEDIRYRCPFSVWLAMTAVRRAREMAGLDEVLDQDRALGLSVAENPADFIEGVRCRMIDKGSKPQWRHAGLEDVDPSEVTAWFESLS